MRSRWLALILAITLFGSGFTALGAALHVAAAGAGHAQDASSGSGRDAAAGDPRDLAAQVQGEVPCDLLDVTTGTGAAPPFPHLTTPPPGWSIAALAERWLDAPRRPPRAARDTV